MSTPANPPIPGVPTQAPAAPAAPAAAAPAPAPAPGPVTYAPETAVVQTVVNGQRRDVTVADLKRQYQVGSAAEQRLQQANQLHNQYRGDLETIQRIRTLSASNPKAALEEAQKALGLRLPPPESDHNSQTQGDDMDARERAILSKLTALEQRLSVNDQFREQVTTQNVVQQIRAQVSALPLYANDAEAAARAERVVLAVLTTNPSASIGEVAGMVHADDEAFVTRQLQRTRDQRAADAQTLASIPTGAGTPQLSMPEMPKLSPEELRGGGLRKAFANFSANVKKTAGI